MLQKACLSLYPVAVLRIWKEHSYLLLLALHYIRLNKVNVQTVRLHHAARYLSLLLSVHALGHSMGFIPFKLFCKALLVEVLWRIRQLDLYVHFVLFFI
jgi:hypothetical protein